MDTSKIVGEVQRNIEFFREKWKQFCQMVESYGKHIDECRNDPACEYDMDAETKRDLKERKLSVNFSNVCYAFNKATQLGNHEKAKRLDQQRQEIEKELLELGLGVEPPEPGCERYDFIISQYLNIPDNHIFWIRPTVNPLDYLLKDYPPEDDLPVVYDCALLSIVHDNGNLTALDKRVFDHTSHEGYFKRKNFCDAVLSKLRENPDSIDRAFDRVKTQLPAETSEQEAAKKEGSLTKWSDLSITIIDENTIKYKISDGAWQTATNLELGFADRRTKGKKIRRIWNTFLLLVKYSDKSANFTSGIQKNVERIGKIFCEYFKLKEGLPIYYDRKFVKYKFNFNIKDERTL